MPDNPVHKDAGNKTHTLQVLKYFNSRHQQIETDYVSERYWGRWAEDDIISFGVMFPNLRMFLLNRKMSKRNKVKYFLKYKLPLYLRKHKWLFKKRFFLPDHNTQLLQRAFNELLRTKEYDYVIISYVTWATLIENNTYLNNARLICDTHDFITVQIKDKKNFKLGAAIEREMYLLSLFHEVWSLSLDEQYLFSQFIANVKHRFIPVMFENNYLKQRCESGDKFDLLFIGNGNEHNVKSLTWFFLEVYPLLPSAINICVVGKIVDHIADFKNVTQYRFLDNLDEVYLCSRVALCPMLSGTGIKIKTVEALSYGLPVVCSLRGQDGLPLKNSNGCLQADSPREFADAIILLLQNEEIYQRTRAQAIKVFTEYFNLKKGYSNLDSIFGVRSHELTSMGKQPKVIE